MGISMRKQITMKGFTLIEILMVLVVVSILVWSSVAYFQQRAQQMRVDRTTMDMQQILNAALSYYIANGSWPPSPSLDCLQGVSPCSTKYLPSNLKSAWDGSLYKTAANAQLFYVYVQVTTKGDHAQGIANTIAGSLPLSYTTYSSSAPVNNTVPTSGTTCANQKSCVVVGSVNIPGQNLNNARSVNFAGLYHHGGCIPVPQCPVDAKGNTMTPQVMVVPVSVSGVNNTINNQNQQYQLYPITSFTAYATETSPLSANPPPCKGGSGGVCTPLNGSASSAYWRACLQVVTERGDVATTNTGTGASAWGQYVTLLAITRCASNNEPAGSNFTVFTQ